jgi:hypothetical protein
LLVYFLVAIDYDLACLRVNDLAGCHPPVILSAKGGSTSFSSGSVIHVP